MPDETRKTEPASTETAPAKPAASKAVPETAPAKPAASKAVPTGPESHRNLDGSIPSRHDPERGKETPQLYADPGASLHAAEPTGQVASSRERTEVVRDEGGVNPVRDPKTGRPVRRLVSVVYATDAGEKFVVDADHARKGFLPARKTCG